MQAEILRHFGEESSYAKLLRKAKEKVNLEELQIVVINTRKVKTGSILLKIKGKEEADLLATKL